MKVKKTFVLSNKSRFSEYCSENRNLCRIVDSNKRRKLLKKGKLAVVSYISDIPRTEHDVNSFTMDISLITGSIFYPLIIF